MRRLKILIASVVRGALWLAGLLAVSSAAPVAQSWKAPAIASFDEVWQTIDESFPDPTFGGLDWNAVRSELRPKAEAAGSPDDVRRVIDEMLSRLHRSHFVLLPSTPAAGDDKAVVGPAIVPIDVRVVDVGPARQPGLLVMDRLPGAASAIRPGQMIVRIGAEDVRTWTPPKREGADERAVKLEIWRRAVRALHGAPDSHVTLTVLDPSAPGGERALEARRVPEPGVVQTFGNLPPLAVRTDVREVTSPGGRRVGMVAFNYWMTIVDPVFASAVDRFRTSPGFVIDLRGNPGGLADMMRGIAGQFFADPVVLGHMQTRVGQLTFTANPRRSTSDGRRVVPFAGPLAILVDELTASTSECFAGALQSLGRARVFGRGTMGQALPASTRGLPDGDVLMYVVGDFETTTGQRLEGGGVVPDQVVPLDDQAVEALQTGRDPVLDAALRWIDAEAGAGRPPRAAAGR